MIKIKKQISHLERKRKTLIDKLLELNDEKVRSETKRTKLIDTLSKSRLASLMKYEYLLNPLLVLTLLNLSISPIMGSRDRQSLTAFCVC